MSYTAYIPLYAEDTDRITRCAAQRRLRPKPRAHLKQRGALARSNGHALSGAVRRSFHSTGISCRHSACIFSHHGAARHSTGFAVPPASSSSLSATSWISNEESPPRRLKIDGAEERPIGRTSRGFRKVNRVGGRGSEHQDGEHHKTHECTRISAMSVREKKGSAKLTNLRHPRSKPQRLTARVKIASAPVFPHSLVLRRGQFPIFCLSVCRYRATSQIWEQNRCSLLLRTRQPKFLHRPKRLRCDSDPAGAATPQIAPPTRAPAGRRLTDARHSRHARSRSHLVATVRPPSLLNHSRRLALKLPCATTLSSLDAAVVTRRGGVE